MTFQFARFRTPEQFMVKTHLFIKVCSLKKRCNKEHYLLKDPRSAGLETLYTLLLISTMEQPFSSIKALLKLFLIPAESDILK
jgi:hypothetical protein